MCTINNRRTGEYYSSVWKVLIWVASPRSLKLHDGVLRDVEQQQRRKHENTYTLQQQIDITKQLKAQEASSPENTLVEEPPCKCKCCTGGAGGPTTLASCSKHPEQPGVGESGDEAEAAANEGAA